MVGRLIADRYELEEEIGAGGMASVFRARDRLLDRTVAVKVLRDCYAADETFVERFRREARAVAQLNHPNIVTVLDRGEEAGRQYIVLELVEGEDLKEHLGKKGPLAVETALRLAVQIGRGLAFAHARGVVHRDVKPQNVIVAGAEAKMTDFGIARAAEADGITLTGTVLGTSDYISPEQACGLPVDERSDVYSLGAVLYELLTGDVPFHGDSPVSVAMRHAREPMPSVSSRRAGVPPRVEAAVARATEKRPQDRFRSMEAFVSELEACLASPEGSADEEATLVSPARPRRRRRARRFVLAPSLLGMAGGAVAAALLVGGGGGGPTLAPHRASASTPEPHPGLRAVAAYDPQGDGAEHDERLAAATDRDAATYWETEHYSSVSFGGLKRGVGLVLDAGKPVKLARLALRSDTPGYLAEIEAGASKSGPFRQVSGSEPVGRSSSFSLDSAKPERYYLLWITMLPPGGEAHVNEVRAAR